MLLALLFAAGIAMALLALGAFGLSGVQTALAASEPGLVAMAVLAQVAALALLAARLKVAAGRYGGLPFWQAFRATAASMVTDFLTPVAKVGGEPVKILMLKKRFGGSKASAIVTVDMLAEVVSTLAVVVLILFLLGGRMPVIVSTALFVLVVIMLFSIALFYGIFRSRTRLRRLVNWTVRRVAGHRPRHDYITGFRQAVKALSGDRKAVACMLAASLMQKAAEMARMWLAFLAVGAVLPAETVVIAWAFMLALFVVPWLPGNLGLVEFGLAGAFVLMGVAGSAAAGGVLLDRLISFWFVLLVGVAAAGTGMRLAHVDGDRKRSAGRL